MNTSRLYLLVDTEPQSLFFRRVFVQAHGRQWRHSECYGWNREVLDLAMIPLQQIGCDYPAAVTRHGSEFWHLSIRRITCRIDIRVGNALKKFIDLHSSFVCLDTGSRKIKVV